MITSHSLTVLRKIIQCLMCCVFHVSDLMFPLESFAIGHIMDLSNQRLLPFTLAQHFRNAHLRTVFCETGCQEHQELGAPEAAEAVWCAHEGCGHQRPRECAAGEAGPALHFSVFSFPVEAAQELADNADLNPVSVGP